MRTIVPWLLPISLLLIWQVAANVGWLEKRILPAPTSVVTAFWHLLLSGELFVHVRVSAGRALLGLLIGGGLGLVLARPS